MFLSIVIPVYNAEKFLEECLDSCLSQNIAPEEYEIICVDDGSKDKSGEILARYADEYGNVSVIATENRGVSAARNTGIEAVGGDYIWFVDSDDVIPYNVLAEIRETAEKSKADILDFGAYLFANELTAEERAKCEANELPAQSFDNHEYACRSLFRRAFLNEHNMRFDEEVSYSEDALFSSACRIQADKIIKTDKACYLLRMHNGSATRVNSAALNGKKYRSWKKAISKFEEFYGICDAKMKPIIADLLMSNVWYLMMFIAGLPLFKMRPYLKRAKADKLYPYRRVPECRIYSSYMFNRASFVGKTYDKIYINMHRPWGFALMRLWQLTYKLYRKVKYHG